MIWGGVAGDPPNTGGRYDPLTGIWRATTTVRAPSGRYDHTAVWTGSRMVVWGGTRSVAKLATGGSYFMDAVATGDCDGDVFTVAAGDCNDNDPSVHPGAPETCNGVDENCDGVIDDGGDALCDDGNPCTSDACEPQGGCVHQPEPEYTSCDDNNLCDGYDYCDGYGYCVSDYSLHCGFYECLRITCDPFLGCQYEPVTAPPEISGLYAPDKSNYSWSSSFFAAQYDVVRGRISTLPVGAGAGDETCFGDLHGASLTDASIPAPGIAYWYLVRGRNSCADPGTYGTRSDGSPRETTTCP